ncbi:guanylate kinase [Candidatus Nitrotoga sp. M5]|nr:guanylate kinase [Candidatus Nitrotoga sp. M5]
MNFQKLSPVDGKITLRSAVKFYVEIAAQLSYMPIHNMPGNLFIISAPSGAGKTSLVRSLLASNQQVDMSVSYTTRAPRPSEIEGKDYHFVSRETFLSMAKQGDFLESAEVYGNLYGTSQSWIEAEISSGRDILLEIDWQGAAQVRSAFPDCISIFILPPSLQALENRLHSRGQDNTNVITQRLHAAKADIAHVVEFDYVIINDKLDIALQQLNAIAVAAGLRRDRQLKRQQTLINQLQEGKITPWPA